MACRASARCSLVLRLALMTLNCSSRASAVSLCPERICSVESVSSRRSSLAIRPRKRAWMTTIAFRSRAAFCTTPKSKILPDDTFSAAGVASPPCDCVPSTADAATAGPGAPGSLQSAARPKLKLPPLGLVGLSIALLVAALRTERSGLSWVDASSPDSSNRPVRVRVRLRPSDTLARLDLTAAVVRKWLLCATRRDGLASALAHDMNNCKILAE